MAKLEIHVTQDDIHRGKPGEVGMCPIALAVKRKINYTAAVSVFDEDLDIDKLSYWLPKEAVDFVRGFDGGAPVEPFYFSLEVK